MHTYTECGCPGTQSKSILPENAAKRALQASGKFNPWNVVTISTDGKILD